MLILSTFLLVLGVVTALMGLKLFRLLLPLVGFIAGLMVGFGGVQAVFGHGVVSTTIGIIMAVIVGAIMAVLSFAFFDLAVVILAMVLGASAFGYLAVAISLGDNGFLLFLLTLAGAILGLVLATARPLSRNLVVIVTSMFGVAYILAGVMLLIGSVSVDQLQNEGIIRTIVNTVDQEFLWLLVWLGGSLFAVTAQNRVDHSDALTTVYEFKEVK